MKIRRGKDKDASAELIQFSNDWIMVDLDGRSKIVTPTSVQVETDGERQRFESTKDSPNVGFFWRAWELSDDGTFTRKKQP